MWLQKNRLAIFLVADIEQSRRIMQDMEKKETDLLILGFAMKYDPEKN